MELIPEPGPGNAYLSAHAALLRHCYRHWTGRHLLERDPDLADSEAAELLYRAPFVVLSHSNDPDPLFTYANLAAQRLFEMSWQDMVGMPSRYSAEAPARAERQHLLARVAEYGYIDDYQGVRIASSGRRFLIRQASVWNLIDATGTKIGQAASFSEWQAL
jgi:hypothetical protein